MVILAEKIKGKKGCRAYGNVIKLDGQRHIKPNPDQHPEQEQLRMFIYGFERLWSKVRDPGFRKRRYRGRRRFPEMDVVIINLNGWLRGIHHHCSVRFVNGYLDEFFFRFNRRNALASIWHQLIEQFMANPPYSYIANAA